MLALEMIRRWLEQFPPNFVVYAQTCPVSTVDTCFRPETNVDSKELEKNANFVFNLQFTNGSHKSASFFSLVADDCIKCVSWIDDTETE